MADTAKTIHDFKIGDAVRHDGEFCKVAAFDGQRLVLRKLWNDGTRWLADPSECDTEG
jgi:hypothetical protein